MKTILRTTLFSLVGSIAFGAIAYGQGTASSQASGTLSNNAVGRVVMGNTVGAATVNPFGPRGFLQGQWGQGPGYDTNQYSVGALIPKHLDPGKSLFFGAIQGTVTEQGDGVGNFGLGYRYYSEERDRLYGISGWYTADGAAGGDYNSVGLSLENIGRFFSVRANGNLVLDDEKTLLDQRYISDEIFVGNNIAVTRQDTLETPYHYAEVLFGTPLPILGRFGVTAHAGPYGLFSSEEENVAGVKVQVDSQFTEDIKVSTSWQNDSVTGSNAFVTVSFAFPHRRSQRWFRQTPIKNRLGDWVDRPTRVNAYLSRETADVAFTNTKDGEAIRVVHIDPNATVAGDGTFESPYSSILAFTNTPDIDIIRVVPNSDGTATGLQNNASLDLFDCQRVLGASLAHVVDAVEYSFALPGQTGSALARMENLFNGPTDAVITLANMNEVSGVYLDGTGLLSGDTGNGINNQAGGIEDFNINRNEIVNSRNGVLLTNVEGTGLLRENLITGSSDDGFRLVNTDPLDLDLFITDNQFLSNNGVGSNVIADEGTMNITTTNNTASLNRSGFGYQAQTGATQNIIHDNNTANENTSADTGTVIDALGGTIEVVSFVGNENIDNSGSGTLLSASLGGDINAQTIHNNNFSGNGQHGFQATVEGAGSTIDVRFGMQNADDTLLPNVASNNGADGANFTASNSGRIDALIENNEFNGNGGDGIGIDADQGVINIGDATHAIVDNVITGNTGAGIGITAAGGPGIAPPVTDVDVNVLENTISSNAGGGIVATGSGANSDIDLVVSDTTITDNAQVGVGVQLSDTATASLDVLDSTITGTTAGAGTTPYDGDGVGVYLNNDSELTRFVVDGNNISSNASNGVDVRTFTQAILELGFIDDNSINSNGANGIFYRRLGESIVDNQFIRGNSLRNNTENGIQLVMEGGSNDFRSAAMLTLNFVIGDGGAGNGNTVTGNGLDGADLTSTGDANLVASIDGNTFDSNGANGLHGHLGFFASLSGVWQNNSFDNNTENGVLLEEGDFTQVTRAVYNRGLNTLTAQDDAFNVDMLDNTMNNNGVDGIQIAVTGEYDIDRNDISNNTRHGMYFNVPGSQQNPQVLLAPSLIVRAGNNTVHDNGGIGINIENSDDDSVPPPLNLDPFDGGGLFVGTFTENEVLRSGYDGISVYNDDNDITLVDFIDNNVNDNAGYGYRIQNYDDDRRTGSSTTSDVPAAAAFVRANISGTNGVTATQGNGANSSVDNNGLGGIFAINSTGISTPLNVAGSFADLDLRVFQTAVRGNGTNPAFDDANNANYLGGFVPTAPDNANGLYLLVGTVDNGEVNADIRNNYLSGNGNVDVVFQSYTEILSSSLAVEPLLTITGTLNSNYHPDPLARLNLRFTGNVGETIDATRQGAFFDNADPFKSPNSSTGNVFNSTARRRNAQRETLDVLRDSGIVVDPPAPAEGTFGAVGIAGAPDDTYLNNYAIFTSGGLNGLTRLITGSTANNGVPELTTDEFPAPPVAGDTFDIWLLQTPGIGVSTFKTEETAVNNNNAFSNIISDFDDVFGLGSGADGAPYPFNWETGIVLPAAFPAPSPFAVP